MAASDREPSLHDRINRISHWDVNVTDLERSRAWYEAVTPLRVVAETHAEQAFPSFGIQRGSFRGYMLKDETQAGVFPMIHLVQWLEPLPVGVPYESHANVGWYRIVPMVEDLDAAWDRVVAYGSEPFFPINEEHVRTHPDLPKMHYRVFTVHDPDKIAVEFADVKVTNRKPVTPRMVGHTTAQLETSFPFYEQTLGLDFGTGYQNEFDIPNVFDPAGGMTRMDGAFLELRGDRRVSFGWLQCDDSHKYPHPYSEPHHVGIVRCALEVDDLQSSLGELRRSHWFRDGRISVSDIEEWDLGDFGTIQVVN